MDMLTLVYYAAICGVLSLVAPRLGRRYIRFGIGVAVGTGAAVVLPVISAALDSAY